MVKRKTKATDKESWDPSDTCEVSIPELLTAVKREGIMAYDLETTGLSPRNDRIEGVAFYVPNEKDPTRRPIRAWYPFTEGTMEHTTNGVVDSLREPMPQVETMEALREVWSLKTSLLFGTTGSSMMPSSTWRLAWRNALLSRTSSLTACWPTILLMSGGDATG